MRAGQLRHRVVIQSYSNTQTASGAFTQTWVTHATVQARISPTGGRDGWQGEVPDSGRMHDIEIRYLSTVTNKMRIKFGTRYFDIKEVITPDERKIRMLLKAEESTDNG